MAITTTSIAFILLSFGLAACGVWLLMTFKKEGGVREYGRVGYLLSALFLGFGLQNGIMGFGALFFAKNSAALYYVLVVSHIFLAAVALLGVYTVCYIFSHQRLLSAFVMFMAGYISINSVVKTIATQPKPFITLQNGIDWNMGFPLSLLVFYTLFISIGSTLYIFIRLFFTVQTRAAKNISLILSVLALLGIAFAFMRLILLYNADAAVRTRFYDFGIIIIGAIFIIAILVILIAPLIKNLIQTRKQKKFHYQ